MTAAVIILSGGAETVSVAVAERLIDAGIDYSVISLVPDSLLRDAPHCHGFHELNLAGAGLEEACDLLAATIASIGGGEGSTTVFATEDDSLLLLSRLHLRNDLVLCFSRGESLRMGGLDKAELFEHLEQAGMTSVLAPTFRLDSPEDSLRLAARLGHDLVIKPIHKPWGRTLDESGNKVITVGGRLPALTDVKRALENAWNNCDGWIAQPRLRPIRQAERSACVIRSGKEMQGYQIVERLKYPRMGGSAAWVSSSRDTDLLPAAFAIAEAIDLRGVCEMSFLEDEQGNPKLLELNCRPWLQFELVEASGCPLILDTLKAVQGRALSIQEPAFTECHWIQPERMFLSLATGDSPRMETLRALARGVRGKMVIPIYGSRLPKVKSRWIARNLRKVLPNGR